MKYNIHNKLRIKSDIELNLPKRFLNKKMGKPNFIIKNGEIRRKKMVEVSPPYISAGKKSLLHKYSFIKPCELLLENLEDKTKLTFTDYYEKLVGTKDLIKCIINIKLLQENIVKIHGSCVELNGKGVIMAGWDQSGKSFTSIRMMEEEGANFLSDDTTLIDEKYAYSFPYNPKKFKGEKRSFKIFDRIPYLNRTTGMYETIEPKSVVDRTKIKNLFIIKKGKEKVLKLSKEESLKAVMTLNLYVSNVFDKKSVILAYSHFNNYDINSLLEKRIRVMKKFLKNVKCYEIRTENALNLKEAIKNNI